MNALLAFAVYTGPPEPVRHAVNTEAMDWFVTATLGCFFFLLGCFVTMGWVIWRRSTRPEPHVQLLMELAESDPENIIHTNTEGDAEQGRGTNPCWERPADWWKSPPAQP